ncbi:protein translocase subunit SecD [Thermodesulfobacteriota bacterium]
MMQNLRWRIATVVVVLLASIFLLYPSVGPVPKWWKAHLPAEPIRLGLDLQGGLHLMMEVQADKAVETQVDQAMGEAAAQMKEVKIKYTDVKRTSPNSFAVYLRDSAQGTLFDGQVLDKLPNFKKVSSQETAKGYEITLGMDPITIEDIKKQAVRQAVDTIRNRVDQFGVAEPDVVPHGIDRIIVQLPGLKQDIDRAIDIIKRTAQLEFKMVDERGNLDAALKGNVPAGSQVLYEIDRNPRTGATKRTPMLIKKRVLLTGDMLTDARVQVDRTGRPYVSMDFNSRGAELFDRVTRDNVGKRLAIILDKRIYSAPVIKSRISGGSAIIEGRFSPEEARDLVIVLRSGSLPAPVEILERRSVGPSLGEDSIRLGRNAVLLGLLLVVAGMAVYYRWSGVVADIALVLNLFLIFAIMVSPGLRATLTLPGLAGVALTMGMAIDANILIFERIREELRLGKSPKAAVDMGYSKAFSTILDANVTTILAALPLIQFGTGPIKGFAVTLCIGLIVSMFTALFVTRVVFDYAFQTMRIKKLSI